MKTEYAVSKIPGFVSQSGSKSLLGNLSCFCLCFVCLFFMGLLSLKHRPHSLLNFIALFESRHYMEQFFSIFRAKSKQAVTYNSEQPPSMSPILTFIYLRKRLLVQYPLNCSLCNASYCN